MNHVGEWKTPELVIHSGKGKSRLVALGSAVLTSSDFRLLDGQGIGKCCDTVSKVLADDVAAFTALQVSVAYHISYR